MNDYMLLKSTGLKVPLKAKDNYFDIKIANKTLLKIDDTTERLLAYWIYGAKNEGKAVRWLCEHWEDITISKIDIIINSFKSSHPAEIIGDFKFSDIPIYATENMGLMLFVLDEYCMISKENELELMDIIVQNKTESFPLIENWFFQFRKKYEFDFRKHGQDYELAVSFLNQHGLNSSLSTNEEIKKINEKEICRKKGDYMLLKSTGLKVPLKAGGGEFKIKSRRKALLSILPSIERLFVYWIYGEQNEAEVARWLRECCDKNITPMQIDEIINSFKSSHPAETVGDFKFGDIPVYATEEEGLPLPMPGEACIISKKHELELMNIIIRNGADSFSVIKNWFFHFRQRYGLDFQRKSWKGFDQDHELAISFLHQHGLNMNLSRFVSEEEEYNGKTKSFFIGLVLFILVFGSFIFWYSVFTDGFTNGISTSKKVDGITNFSAIICGIATFFLSLWGSFNNSSIVNLNYAPHIALLCVAIGFVLFFVNMFAQFFLSLILLFVVNI